MADQALWVELPTGMTAPLSRVDGNGAFDVSLNTDVMPLRAALWSGAEPPHAAATWIGALAVAGATEHHVTVRVDWPEVATAPPTVQALARSGAPLNVHLASGRPSLLAWRRYQRRQAGAATAVRPQASSSCAANGCGVTASTLCERCQAPRCADHVRGLSGGHALCGRCLDLELTAIVASAVRSSRAADAAATLRRWAQAPNPPSVAQYLLGLLEADAGTHDQALGLLEPLLRRTDHLVRGFTGRVARIRTHRATQAVEAGDMVTAATLVAGALELDPSLPAARAASPLLRDWQVVASIRAGRVDEAIQLWQADLDRRPTDARLVHRLAILTYRRASELAARADAGDHTIDMAVLEGAWRPALGLWAVTLFSEAFWTGWRADRHTEAGLQLSDDDLTQIRSAYERRFAQDLRDATERARTGRPDLVALWSNLVVQWSFERRVATAIQDHLAASPVDGWPSGWCPGPTFLDTLARNETTQGAVLAMRKALVGNLSATAEPLRRYLSPLGRQHYLIETSQYERAVQELLPLADWPQAVELLGVAWSAKCDEALTARDCNAAVDAFEQAKRYGTPDGALLDRLIDRLVDTIMDRVESASPPDFDAAIDAFTRGIAVLGDDERLTAHLAGVLRRRSVRAFNNDRTADAVADIRRAVELQPNDPDMRGGAGIVLSAYAVELHDAGRTSEAATVAREAEAYLFEPEVAENLTVYYRKAGRPGDVVRIRKALYARDPSDTEQRHLLHVALHNLGVDHANAKRWDPAISALREALTIEAEATTRGELISVLRSKAASLADGDHWGDAIRAQEEALAVERTAELVRDLAYLHAAYGRSLADKGQWSAAFRELSTARGLNDDQDVRHVLAIIHLRHAVALSNQNDLAGGRRAIEEAYRLDPNDSQIRDIYNNTH